MTDLPDEAQDACERAWALVTASIHDDPALVAQLAGEDDDPALTLFALATIAGPFVGAAVQNTYDIDDNEVPARWAQIPNGERTMSTDKTPIVACPFCGHARHDDEFCLGWTDEECPEPCCPHPCACSYPDPANYSEVPER